MRDLLHRRAGNRHDMLLPCLIYSMWIVFIAFMNRGNIGPGMAGCRLGRGRWRPTVFTIAGRFVLHK
jgi:hypothetical protein